MQSVQIPFSPSDRNIPHPITTSPHPSNSSRAQTHHPHRSPNHEKPITMPTSPSLWTIGCLYGASAVAFGAFGAHGLRARIADPARIKSWETAAHYQVTPIMPLAVASLSTRSSGGLAQLSSSPLIQYF
jgi:hypothetical protein